jgi:hypothetical protein
MYIDLFSIYIYFDLFKKTNAKFISFLSDICIRFFKKFPESEIRKDLMFWKNC